MTDDTLIIRPKRGEDGYKTFSIRIRENTVDQLDDVARQTGRSRNELIGVFLDFALNHCKIEDNSSEK